MSVKCYNCQADLDLSVNNQVMRSEECPKCYVNIRSCRMCKFYDKSSYNECREPVAERIVDKEKANFCDHFSLSEGLNSLEDKTNDALAAANALFKK